MKYFVTGATGFIGSHFVVDQADEHQIVALIRGESRRAARDRLDARLRTAADAYAEPVRIAHDNIDCVVGDVELPSFGLDIDARTALRARDIDIFWHFAADLNFEKHKDEQILNVNVEGVRRALDLAAEIGVRRFVYVSTAYTAGPTTGVVPEELHSLEGPFNNSYERSKCMAEHVVADYCRDHEMEFTILRPSVIIGVSATKRPGGATTGMYAFIRDLYLLRRGMGDMDIELTISADPKMIVNLNPIDGVLADIRYLVEHGFADGPIHHLTATDGLRLEDAFSVLETEVGLTSFRVSDETVPIRTPFDEAIGKRAEFYKSYVFNEKNFARSIPMRHGCSESDFEEYTRSYIRELECSFAAS